MPKLKITAADLVAEARGQIPELTTEEAIARHGDPDTIIVDIRDVRERQKSGFIPGSVHAPRGMIEFWVDPDSPYHKPVFDQPGKSYLFHCASGWRSALTVARLQDMGFEAAHIRDGFTDWVKQGGPVEQDPAKD
ncbi:rhodanese-like domain-containing protein [Primorskyibacter sp. 2E107]|uniref:rhodanese-like domain-containing protein n=1 Tax=Primorskyibacter sp. 2E107 TaxID=3403458 RepID=UPI003AF680CB